MVLKMKNWDLSNFLFFISKPSYSRIEAFSMIFIIFFIAVIYSNTIDFVLGLEMIDYQYLIRKIYLNWFYLICSIFTIYYSKILKFNEIDIINHNLDSINNNLNEIGDQLNGGS